MHCVDLGESFPTSIYLQKSASIQPRTSPSKFGGKYSILFNRVLNQDPFSLWDLLGNKVPTAKCWVSCARSFACRSRAARWSSTVPPAPRAEIGLCPSERSPVGSLSVVYKLQYKFDQICSLHLRQFLRRTSAISAENLKQLCFLRLQSRIFLYGFKCFTWQLISLHDLWNLLCCVQRHLPSVIIPNFAGIATDSIAYRKWWTEGRSV